MAERLRPLTSEIPEVPGSNPSPAVASLGKCALSDQVATSLSEETLSRRSRVYES